MSSDGKEFYGKDVASAIKEACTVLGTAQENLNIEVLETGSTGIFGLIRKKAHIRVTIQPPEEPEAEEPKEKVRPKKQASSPGKKKRAPQNNRKPATPAETEEKDVVDMVDDLDDDENSSEEAAELSAESLEIIKTELIKLLDLMQSPSEVTVTNDAGTALCKIDNSHEDFLTGQEGRTLDSLQYILRKIVSRKISGRVRLTIDVGDYRERRHQELREKAVEYAALVKENGKTQVIPSLNPYERRVVHVALQDDTEIRSRSVGDGLFKKVLIYKPGKGRKSSGRKKSRGRYRKKNNQGRKTEK
ncbi:MAG: RNA-binding protein [Desulfobulbaceae bacterium]|nr:MAG: RNA-binding protein [Desulfobulbaceae bacterium]